MFADPPPAAVAHNPAQQRFERHVPGAPTPFLSYTRAGDHVVFDHTSVPPELRGHGIAAELTRAALEHAREHHWRIVPACSYVATYINRHPEFEDLTYPLDPS